MKRVAMLALVLAFGISCDDSPTGPSDPNVARFTAILLPSNEVPAITNADATASGTMQLTMTVTRDAANIITGATYDFVINFTGFPANTTLTGAHIHNAPAGHEHGRRGWTALDGQRRCSPDRPGHAHQDRPHQHVRNRICCGRRPGYLQQPGRQLLQRSHHDKYRRRHSRAAGESELVEPSGLDVMSVVAARTPAAVPGPLRAEQRHRGRHHAKRYPPVAAQPSAQSTSAESAIEASSSFMLVTRRQSRCRMRFPPLVLKKQRPRSGGLTPRVIPYASRYWNLYLAR